MVHTKSELSSLAILGISAAIAIVGLIGYALVTPIFAG
jgi:hypothetical protein